MRPSGLLPNFGAGGLEVRLDVLLVFILIGHDVLVALSFGVGFGEVDGAVAEAGRGAELVGDDIEVGAGDFEEHLLFERNFVGHDGQQTMAARTGHAGKADAGVAGGWLDEAAAFGEFAAVLKIAQQGPGGAVLDGAEGIHPFELGVERKFGVGIEPVDAHQRRRVVLARHHFKDVFVDACLVVHGSMGVDGIRVASFRKCQLYEGPKRLGKQPGKSLGKIRAKQLREPWYSSGLERRTGWGEARNREQGNKRAGNREQWRAFRSQL